MSAQESKESYMSKLSPWTRSPALQPSKGNGGEPEPSIQQQKKGADHVVNHKHRLSPRDYPKDCPLYRPQWFHAVDIPKRRPHPAAGDGKEDEKPAGTPKKYVAFSTRDSKAIEVAFRKLVQHEDDVENSKVGTSSGDISHEKPNISLNGGQHGSGVKVPVNEDYLFDVDIERRELGPAYWRGPVYDVRRGTWFYHDGSVQRPCDENLSAQLEEGYLKIKPWKITSPKPARPTSQPPARPTSGAFGQNLFDANLPSSTQLTSNSSETDLRLRPASMNPSTQSITIGSDQPPKTYRLFGPHSNSAVTYENATTAWLFTEDSWSRMNYSMYERFGGGGHFAGSRITRGFIRPDKKVEPKDEKAADDKPQLGKVDAHNLEQPNVSEDEQQPGVPETKRQNLTRQMSSLLEDPSEEDPVKQAEEERLRDEREIEDDYREMEGEEQDREIEHLILVTHGIGQRLGLRIEAINFVHDVNVLRKTIKAVYADSPDLRALNSELDEAESLNSRVQVLPICWRHLLDFPKQSLKHNRKEHDLADTDIDDEDFPSLQDITVDGVPAVRNLITDLALDILLYQSPAYKDHITNIVLQESNRIYRLFLERHPDFNGKVSLIGHSLGSAIMFDILCNQDGQRHDSKSHRKAKHSTRLDFEVEEFYALGSPIGLFQMLKGRTIKARPKAGRRDRVETVSTDDPMLDMPSATPRKPSMQSATPPLTDISSSSPNCAQIFNIFHPTDPISYRLEPLISPAMATLKPQPLPYTKRGIFGAPMNQGFTGISARVSQSVSSMWSSMASSLLTRGLGYNGDETPKMINDPATVKSSVPLSMGAGTNISGGVIPDAPLLAEGTEIAKVGADEQDSVGRSGRRPPTLIEAELETLYGGFEKRRKSIQNDATTRDLGAGAIDSSEWAEAEERAKRLRREEEKVRRLNSNGRVDYAIQEGVFDINLIAAIASHLSYWSDEDVSHFIISQLLSRHRVMRPTAANAAGPQAQIRKPR